ncbi:SCF E3 ubiquitin ligase complex F-box protein GRR1-like [Aphidius gifuensis]|uniref:SCF E3 ubiquitin ligase complex F-box protein GRR1-like n=1 Tax=Aphidius gifuensis TaxID=684658 RepID=UPI001CDBB3B5|nr:SCF E3 ubiquitin ligase complex F-box protein GRR1-like [Aphidius gifuensis]XP_044001842.1 SCF E3 ubiquitin ligase complex F-box protein GRR1-like [Aphidius gifuensis]
MGRAKRRRIKKNHQVSTDYVEEKVDFINSLDNDSLAQIFMMLPISERIAMDQVCFKWKEACQLAWHDIKKYKCTNTIVRNNKKCVLTQSHVKKILFKCGIYIKELILSKICDSSIMPIIAEYCRNLSTLEFELDVDGDHRYTDLCDEAFTQLKQLKVVKIHITGDILKSQMLNSLPNDINEIHLFFPFEWGEFSCSNRGMWVSDCCSSYYIPPSRFSLRKFTNLRKLTIRTCDITSIIKEISKKTTLVYLDLQKCRTEKEIFTFNQLSNLEHLNIKDVYFVDSRMKDFPNLLSGIFNSCKNLKHLDAPGFHVDLAEIKMENWVNLKNLVYLNIRWQASDAIIKNIIKYCNNLEFINIDKLNSESTIKLTRLENLNYLKFAKTNNINNEVMAAILNNCKKLKHLEIDRRSRVEASIFDDLSKLQYIENLNLSSCDKVGDSAIIAIAKNCKLLKSLNIGACFSITSTAFIALTSLKNLKELDVAVNENVEDNFIVKLRGIKSFFCYECDRLTDAGVIQFIKNNPDLEFLNINDTYLTIETIVGAEEAVKNRTNDTFLTIESIGLDFKEALIESPWLIYRE